MADLNPSESQKLCAMAIADVMKKLPTQFPQYPEISVQFNAICEEEAFDDMDVLLDDVGEGFEESVLCENLADKINIKDEDKEPLCTALCTLLTNFQPALILNVAEMETKVDKEDVNAMTELVKKQVKYLSPTGQKDLDLLKVMIVGRKHNFPLLTYLLDAYARRRLLHYILLYQELEQIESSKKRERFVRTRFNEEYQERKFVEESDVMQKIESKDVLSWYKYSLVLAYRRGAKPLFITPSQTAQCKINDSMLTFAIYYIGLLSAINNILHDSDTKLAQQIDFWIIPKSIKRSDDDSDNDDDDEKDNDEQDYNIEQRLKFVDKLVTQTVEKPDIDILSKTFFQIYKKIVAGKRGKRIVFLIDRRENEKNNGADKLYGFLPKNSQNIPSDVNGDYLHEAMFNLSQTEILPNTDDGTEDAITVEAPGDMCVLSMHIHSTNMVQAYWYFNGSYSRWFENDMVKIWPLYFVGESVDEKTGKITYQDVKPIEELIKQNQKNIPLKDDNFDTFWETTTGLKRTAYST
eukprot:156753_1